MRTTGVPRSQDPLPRRTLQKPHAGGPQVILGGRLFLMSEVPLSLLPGSVAVANFLASTSPQREGVGVFFNCLDLYRKSPDSGERQ